MTSRTHLTDRDLERFLRARSSAPDAAVLEEILATSRGLPQERPRWRLVPQSPRMTILWAALLLTALLVGATLAGAGLLRLPWPTDRDPTNIVPLAGPITNCHRPLPHGVVLTAVGVQQGSQLTVYADGLAVQGPPVGWGAGTENGLEGSWQQRRLTLAGIERLLDSIATALPDCRQIQADGFIDIQARRDDGPYAVRIGQDVVETRVTTDAEAAAAEALADRLAASDLGLSAADWLDASWTAWTPDRWQVWLRFMPADAPPWEAGEGIVLPDGSRLRTFGSEADSGEPGAVERCGVVGVEEARAIATTLTDAGGRAPPEAGGGDAYWYFTIGEVADMSVQISILGLLPHELDCVSELEAEPSPTPAPPPALATGDAAPLPSACNYLSADAIREVIGETPQAQEDYPGWSADWSFCWYALTEDGLFVASTRSPTATARAAEQATNLFGEQGLMTDELAGHEIFLNGCATSGETCRAALALSVEPHFVVISWVGGSRDTLGELAKRVVEELAQP